METKKNITITFLSTWPEVPDGIATFCENLAINLPPKYKNKFVHWNVVKDNWIKQIKNKYPNKILYSIKYDKLSDYKNAAVFINNQTTDIVIIQFINSIYGGHGKYIFEFLKYIKKPVIIVLHSVAILPTQSDVKLKQQILKEFAQRNLDVVVMTKIAQNFLINKIGFSKNKVHQIYHGAPKFDKISPPEKQIIRSKLGFKLNEKIIFTYGILREDKGIDEIIKALPIINKYRDDVRLLLCGDEQDPEKKYSKYLLKIINELNLHNKIKFINKFIPQNDIGKYLQVCDIFITAQKNIGLHSSGTLSYALSTGSVIISTPTIHAKELLKDKGLIVPNNNSDTIANLIIELLSNKTRYSAFKESSMAFSKNIYWPKISKDYLKTIIKIIK